MSIVGNIQQIIESYDETKHKRAADGKFTSKGDGGTQRSAQQVSKSSDGRNPTSVGGVRRAVKRTAKATGALAGVGASAAAMKMFRTKRMRAAVRAKKPELMRNAFNYHADKWFLGSMPLKKRRKWQAIQKRSRESKGQYDETKHKRDKSGRFSSTAKVAAGAAVGAGLTAAGFIAARKMGKRPKGFKTPTQAKTASAMEKALGHKFSKADRAGIPNIITTMKRGQLHDVMKTLGVQTNKNTSLRQMRNVLTLIFTNEM